MKSTINTFITIILVSLISSLTGFAQEIISGNQPSHVETIQDAEFLNLREQMKEINAQTFDFGAVLENNDVTPIKETLTENPQQQEQVSVTPTSFSHQSTQLLHSIFAQQLAQIDLIKSLLLKDLQNYETIGYRGIKIEIKQPLLKSDNDIINQTPLSANYFSESNFETRVFLPTSRNLDLAIHGHGFFVTQKESSNNQHGTVYYTRAGHFEISKDQKLGLFQNNEFYYLTPLISVPKNIQAIEYRKNGNFFVTTRDGQEINIGSLKIALFDDLKQLQRHDGVFFTNKPSAKEPILQIIPSMVNTMVYSSQLETSNVNFSEIIYIYRSLHEVQTLLLQKISP